MNHDTSRAPRSNDLTPAGYLARTLGLAAAALLWAWLLLLAAAPADGAAPDASAASCRVRYTIITLRQGPGFPYAAVKPPLKRNTALAPVGRSEKPQWLLVQTDAGTQGWALVDQLLCDPLPDLPLVEAPPEPKPTPRPRSDTEPAAQTRSGTGSAGRAEGPGGGSGIEAGTRAPGGGARTGAAAGSRTNGGGAASREPAQSRATGSGSNAGSRGEGGREPGGQAPGDVVVPILPPVPRADGSPAVPSVPDAPVLWPFPVRPGDTRPFVPFPVQRPASPALRR